MDGESTNLSRAKVVLSGNNFIFSLENKLSTLVELAQDFEDGRVYGLRDLDKDIDLDVDHSDIYVLAFNYQADE